jgi:hypothetical protein
MLGPTRSGKSLLCRLLQSHSEFAWALEPITIWNYRMGRRDDDVRSADEATKPVIARCRREIARFLDATGASRYADDLPHHTLRLSFCRAVLPEAKFVIVVRDPRDTIPRMIGCWMAMDTISGVVSRRLAKGRYRSIRLSSIPSHALKWLLNRARRQFGFVRMNWGPTVPGQRAFSKTHSLHETVAYQWTKLAEYAANAADTLPASNALLIRYEELIADPAVHMHRVAEFCGVEDAQAFVEAATQEFNPNWPAPRVTLTQEQWDDVMRIASPIAHRLGYLESHSTNCSGEVRTV